MVGPTAGEEGELRAGLMDGRANQALRWAGWGWLSRPEGWTCVSVSCSCWGWTAASPRSPHCSLAKGDAAASGPQQSTCSPSNSSISSLSPTAPLGRNLKRSFFNVLSCKGARVLHQSTLSLMLYTMSKPDVTRLWKQKAKYCTI